MEAEEEMWVRCNKEASRGYNRFNLQIQTPTPDSGVFDPFPCIFLLTTDPKLQRIRE